MYVCMLRLLTQHFPPEAEPPQPSCMVTFCKPLLKTLLVFILPGDGLFGTIFYLLGCILSYCSFFTISYQARIIRTVLSIAISILCKLIDHDTDLDSCVYAT